MCSLYSFQKMIYHSSLPLILSPVLKMTNKPALPLVPEQWEKLETEVGIPLSLSFSVVHPRGRSAEIKRIYVSFCSDK